MSALDGEAALSPQDVESLLLEAWPERAGPADGRQAEWIGDITDVGRVRCVAFHDHRGPGGMFRMIPAKALSADQLGLSREIQALCTEPEGLVLVIGPRASGKSTLISAFVDLINRTRSDHVITLEPQVKVVHESRSALVSQREVRGGAEELLGALRGGAAREPGRDRDRRPARARGDRRGRSKPPARAIWSSPGSRRTRRTAALARLVDQAPVGSPRRSCRRLLAETLRGVVARCCCASPEADASRRASCCSDTHRRGARSLLRAGRSAAAGDGKRPPARHGPVHRCAGRVRPSGAVDVREAWRKAERSGGAARSAQARRHRHVVRRNVSLSLRENFVLAVLSLEPDALRAHPLRVDDGRSRDARRRASPAIGRS